MLVAPNTAWWNGLGAEQAPGDTGAATDWWAQNTPAEPAAPAPTPATGGDFGAIQNLDFGSAYTPEQYTAGQFTEAAPTFTAPTGVTQENDPGYLFRLQQAQQAVERSAAARGTVLNPGTQSAIAQRVGDLASSEFGNVFNRAGQTFQNNLATYGAKYNTFMGNEGLRKSAFDTNQASAFQARQLSDQEKQAQQASTLSQQGDYWTRLQQLANAGQQGAVATVAA